MWFIVEGEGDDFSVGMCIVCMCRGTLSPVWVHVEAIVDIRISFSSITTSIPFLRIHSQVLMLAHQALSTEPPPQPSPNKYLKELALL